jgi:hypothetical protein
VKLLLKMVEELRQRKELYFWFKEEMRQQLNREKE